jgi:hypothetical protein
LTTVDEFYKVGPGPSSSHTIGPMRITYDFYQRATKLPADKLAKATALKVHLSEASALPEKATYRMWAVYGGIKWNGLAVNGQYYFRWLNDFEADGPLPLDSTFDHGFELVAGKFVIPRKLMAYGRLHGQRTFR